MLVKTLVVRVLVLLSVCLSVCLSSCMCLWVCLWLLCERTRVRKPVFVQGMTQDATFVELGLHHCERCAEWLGAPMTSAAAGVVGL